MLLYIRVKIHNLEKTLTVVDPKFFEKKPAADQKYKANFSTGTAAQCLDNIVQQNDMYVA